jgi:hypothetical protein
VYSYIILCKVAIPLFSQDFHYTSGKMAILMGKFGLQRPTNHYFVGDNSKSIAKSWKQPARKPIVSQSGHHRKTRNNPNL